MCGAESLRLFHPVRVEVDCDLVTGRQDVGQHRALLRCHPVGQPIHRRLSERHSDVLGLRAVDQVPEDQPMPDAPSSARQCENTRCLHISQCPHAEMQETMTRSPTCNEVTAEPTS